MFANFELYSGGLVQHTGKPKRAQRSIQACLPCRQAKKKCDEQQPTCRRCEKRHIQCEWHASSSKSSSSRPRQSSSRTSSRSSSVQPDDDDKSLVIPRTTVKPAVTRALNAIRLADVGDISSEYFWDLARFSNHALHGAYFDDGYSLLPLSISMLSESQSYMNMWLSLSAMRIAHLSPATNNQWLGAALRHHNRALQAVGQHLSSSKPPDDWVLCTILLLHIFEKFGSADQPPSYAHLTIARPLFMQRYAEHPPKTIHGVLQIESLIYRMAITSTFYQSGNAQYESVSELIELCNQSQVDCGLWRHSLWIGVPQSIFDIVYKLSFLLKSIPLTGAWLDELDVIEGKLTMHRDEKQVLHEGQSQRENVIAEQAYISLQLYTRACFVILAKLRGREVRFDDIAPGFATVEHLSRTNFISPVLLWPVAIIGLCATTEQDRGWITAYVDALEPYSGLRATKSVSRLLGTSWGGRGSDVLFDDTLLSSTFI